MTESIPGSVPGASSPPPPLGPPPPPPQTSSPLASPPLARSRSDRRVAGVCGGVAAHLRVAPWIFRAGFVVLTFFGGFGLLLYILAWVVLPEEGSPQRAGWSSVGYTERHNTTLIVALLITALAVAIFAGGSHGHAGLFFGLALLGLGVFLLVQERQHWSPSLQTTPTSSPPMPYAAGVFTPGPAPTAAAPWTTWQQPLIRPRSILGVVTLAAVLLAIGITALLDSAGVVSVSLGGVSAIALIVVGAGLVAGTWFGRSRALIVFGILLLPFTAATALVNEPLNGGVGNVSFAPQTLGDLHNQYHLAAGRLTIDLSQIPLTASPTVAVTVALGRLTVVIPPGANYDVTAHAGAGHIDVVGAVDDGVNIDSPLSQSPSPGGGTLHLALSVGFGEIDVVNSTGNAVPSQ